MVTSTPYEEAIDAVHDRYEPRIQAFLGALRAMFEAEGWEAGPVYEMADEDYSWWLDVVPPGGDQQRDGIDMQLTIEESAVMGDEPGGVTLGLMIVRYGGLILGQLTPYNYTPSVWVPMTDEDAVERRFELVLNEGVIAETFKLITESAATAVG